MESPVLNIGLLAANRAFAFSNLAALINYGATFAVGFLLSLYLQVVRGLDPGAAGLVLITQPVIQALFATPAGRLSDRVEPRYVASAGMGLTAVGLALLTLLTAATPMTWIVASLVLLGFGFALFSSPNTHAVMSSVDRSLYGLASGCRHHADTGLMFSLAIAPVTSPSSSAAPRSGRGPEPFRRASGWRSLSSPSSAPQASSPRSPAAGCGNERRTGQSPTQ